MARMNQMSAMLTNSNIVHLVVRASTDKNAVCGKKLNKNDKITQQYGRVTCRGCMKKGAKL